ALCRGRCSPPVDRRWQVQTGDRVYRDRAENWLCLFTFCCARRRGFDECRGSGCPAPAANWLCSFNFLPGTSVAYGRVALQSSCSGRLLDIGKRRPGRLGGSRRPGLFGFGGAVDRSDVARHTEACKVAERFMITSAEG